MKIDDNIIKHYLKNVFFITGTAYAGKSTMCKMLADKFGLYHCGENYHSDIVDKIAIPARQPNICYLRTMKDWQEFVNRTPEEYERWIYESGREVAEFEVTELIRISQSQKVIVDTNIPIDILQKITDYNHVAIMVSPQAMSVEKFFERNDPDKTFIKEQIIQAEDPKKTMANYRECIASVNSKEHYDEYVQSGFYTLVRKDAEKDTKAHTLEMLAKHFRLIDEESIYISTERLYIRPFEEKDFEQFKTLLDLYPGWEMQREHDRQFFEWQLSNYEKMDIENGYICLGIFQKDTDRLIGNIGLNEHDELHVPELGYGILEAYRGKGYAKEAAKAALCWAKSYFNIPYLVGTAEVSNTASRKVLEYCGFELEDIKNLEVHIINKRYNFATYKYLF